MKWNNLSNKTPPFKEKLLLGLSDGDWKCGYLDGIVETVSGKEFKFTDSMQNEIDCVVFWAIPKVPELKK